MKLWMLLVLAALIVAMLAFWPLRLEGPPPYGSPP